MLKARASQPTTGHSALDSSEVISKSSPANASAKPPDRSSSPYRAPPQLPTLSPTHRPPPRDLTSSIASNLASARGIPSTHRRRGYPASPALSADQAGGKILSSLEKKTNVHPSRLGGQEDSTRQSISVGVEAGGQTRKQWVDERKAKNAAPSAEESDVTLSDLTSTPNPEPFQRFYSTFETLISKLSAPLAFAGLPLTTEVQTPAVPEKIPFRRERAVEHERVGGDPDLTRIFSKAALRAVKERTGAQGLGAGAESFYFVPTTGGTISYAGILSKAEEERRASGLLEGTRGKLEDDEEPEFVDASETPHPPSPERSRQGGGRTWRYGSRPSPQQQPPPPPPPASMTGSMKTAEELQVENQALKQLSDTLSRRLHMWEMNAQSSSMALQHSLRALQRSQIVSSEGGAGKPTAGSEDPLEKIKALEDQVRTTRREMERLDRENEKLRAVVSRYREKWEKLKEGARMRREGTNRTDDPAKE